MNRYLKLFTFAMVFIMLFAAVGCGAKETAHLTYPPDGRYDSNPDNWIFG